MDERSSSSADSLTIYSERRTCRGCASTALVSVLDLGEMYLPRFVPEPDESLPKAPLHLTRCAKCGLLQLAHTVQPDLLYREFWYRSGINESMRAALQDVVAHALTYRRGGAWLDIGANDGYLLSCVPPNFRKVACEPALNMRSELEELSDYVISDYFSYAATGHGLFEVITSAAMFYDLDDPGAFLDDIRKSLDHNGVWINQLNDAPTMLKQNAFDAICHEHLTYYDLHTLENLYREHGLSIVSVTFNDVNGSSMRVVAQRSEDVRDQVKFYTDDIPRTTEQDVHRFATRVKRWRELFRSTLHHLGTDHWCYGASTKGSTLLQYIDCRELFTAVADRNQRKHGLRMVGSWTPIRSEEDFRAAKPKYALVLPWAFRSEFIEREVETRANGTALIFPLPNPEIVL